MKVLTKIKGSILKKILYKAGYTQTEFAEFIDRSRQFANERIFSPAIVAVRWVERFIEFIGEPVFKTLYEEITGENLDN